MFSIAATPKAKAAPLTKAKAAPLTKATPTPSTTPKASARGFIGCFGAVIALA